MGLIFFHTYGRHLFQSHLLDSPFLTCWFWCVGKTPMDHMTPAPFWIPLTVLIYLSVFMAQLGGGEFFSWSLSGHWLGASTPHKACLEDGIRCDSRIYWMADLRRGKQQCNIISKPEWHIVMSVIPSSLTDNPKSSGGSFYTRMCKSGSWSHSVTFWNMGAMANPSVINDPLSKPMHNTIPKALKNDISW